MVDHDFLRGCRKEVILFNTSRGPVAEERALLKGITEGILSDVVLDVFENEPGINGELLDAITIGTPHVAGYSLDGKANGTTISVRALSRFFGLGLDHWEPSDIPRPGEPELHGDLHASGGQELLWELYRNTYDIEAEDARLRKDPDRFEELRGDYPFRREPFAYSIRLFGEDPGMVRTLEDLGFSVLGNSCM
jgi:erythronate-4-phosphate dehydrogenase